MFVTTVNDLPNVEAGDLGTLQRSADLLAAQVRQALDGRQ
jgi:hypothetical protein